MRRFSVAAAILLSFCQAASAGLIITAESTSLPFSSSAQTGSFEVYVANDGAGQAISMFQAQLALSPAAAGVSFTGASNVMSADHPYVLPGANSFFALVSDGGSVIDAGDINMSGTGLLEDGSGLFKVDFSVAPSTPAGVYNVLVSSNPSLTALQDGAGANVPYTVQGGTITITPEPTGIVLFLLGLGGFGLYLRHRRRLQSR